MLVFSLNGISGSDVRSSMQQTSFSVKTTVLSDYYFKRKSIGMFVNFVKFISATSNQVTMHFTCSAVKYAQIPIHVYLFFIFFTFSWLILLLLRMNMYTQVGSNLNHKAKINKREVNHRLSPKETIKENVE